MNRPVVSICIITYNQVAYIKACIDGILKQKFDFNYEIIIADDYSNDGTSEICAYYAALYPEKIKYFKNEKNLGMIGNWTKVIFFAKGKFIALCEGDDYWVDESKIKKQVDFLESNPDYAICFHRVYTLSNKKIEISKLNESLVEKTYTIEDLAEGNFIHTPSVVFRNNLFQNFPDWFSDSSVADYVLHMLNSKHGNIKYLPDLMAVYRIHPGGIWSQQNIITVRKKWNNVLDYLLQENFSDNVKRILLRQKQQQLVANLKDLFFLDAKRFKIELKEFIGKYPQLTDEWVVVHYPDVINIMKDRIFNTKEFKIGNSIIKPLKKIKNLFWSNR